MQKHAQAPFFLAFSMARASPLSFSFIWRLESSVALRALRSLMGGMASGGFLMRGEDKGGDGGHGVLVIDDIVSYQ